MTTSDHYTEPRNRLANGARPGEAWMWGIVIVLLVFDMSLFTIQGDADAIPGFLSTKLLIAPFLAIGLIYRLLGRDERVATTLLAVACFAMFTHVAALASHAFLPLSRPLIDTTLAAWDAALGFHWPDALVLAAEFPTLTLIGKYIYASSIMQVSIATLVLGIGGWTLGMERFVLSCMTGAVVVISFWIVFPSFGPTTLYAVPQHVLDVVQPIAGPEYGASLLKFAVQEQEGLAHIQTRGLIAFPSYHTVMAILVPLALWPVRWLRWPALGVNAAMMPFIIVHGGHYAIDLMAGAVVAVACWILAGRLVHGLPRQSANSSLEVGSRPSAA